MEAINDLFDVFDESNDDSVGLYLANSETASEITK